MHFTIFGNLFNGSASRNPLMRFGTFDVTANVFRQASNKAPLYNSTASVDEAAVAAVPSDAVYGYNLGVYNQSTVLVRENAFVQTGTYPNDTSRLFTLSEDTRADLPARLCIPAPTDVAPTTLNGQTLDLLAVAEDMLQYHIDVTGNAVTGGVLLTCEGIEIDYTLPVAFTSGEEVQKYVSEEAGMY